MDPLARLRLGRNVQQLIVDMTGVKEMRAVIVREAIMYDIETAEAAGAFWTAVRPEGE